MMTSSGSFSPPPATPETKKSSGCLKWGAIGCTVILVLGLLAIAGIAAVVFGLIKSTDAYKEAVRRARNDSRVAALVGTPVETRFWVTGNVNVTNNRGDADITIPICGPRGNAKLYAVATLDPNGWHFTELVVRPSGGGAEINLLSP